MDNLPNDPPNPQSVPSGAQPSTANNNVDPVQSWVF